MHISKIYNALGKKVIYLDVEKGVNNSQLDGIGLTPFMYDEKTNPNGLFYYFRPTTYEDCEEILDELLSEGIDLVIIDSATAMMPGKFFGKKKDNGDIDTKKKMSIADVEPGLQARLTAAFLMKYKAETSKSKTTFICINQMRTKIRFMGPKIS